MTDQPKQQPRPHLADSLPDPAEGGTAPPQPASGVEVTAEIEPGLQEKVEQLLAKHEELLTKTEKPKPKDRWDKLGLSGPLMVAAVGVLLTTVYQFNVTRQAKITQEATQRAQNLQSFGTFMQYLTSADSVQQELAITALRRLGNCEVAALAAGLNPSGGTRAGLLELRRVAEIHPDTGCGFADTVWQRVFLDPDEIRKIPPGGPLPKGLEPPETISRSRVPLDSPGILPTSPGTVTKP
jgi:hypothetical protein